MQLHVAPNGATRCIYDELIDLAELGQLRIVRASHVEPDAFGLWWVDLSPVAGPTLGPFSRRTDGLAAEVRWLLAHWPNR